MNYAQFREDLKAATDQRLILLKEKVGVNAAHSVVEGLVPDEIQKEAARWGADLIVTGRGGIQGALGRLWSHLYPIIRHAACPVLSI
jgi:nucleotide-binding universal stress UspA family protein